MVGLDPVVGVRPAQRVLPWACRWPAEGTGGLFGVAPWVARESGAMDCLLPGGGARACVYLPRKSRRTTWGSWSGGLVGELGADVHRVIIDREAPEQGVADQDLVQHLRVALEHRGVALGLDQAHWALSTRRPADPQFIVTAPNVLLQCLPRRTTLAQRSLEPAHRTWLELGKA